MAQGFPGSSDGKESDCSAGEPGLIPRLGTSPGEGNANALQHCCLENSKDRGAWQASVHGVTKSQTQLITRLQEMESEQVHVKLLNQDMGDHGNSEMWVTHFRLLFSWIFNNFTAAGK